MASQRRLPCLLGALDDNMCDDKVPQVDEVFRAHRPPTMRKEPVTPEGATTPCWSWAKVFSLVVGTIAWGVRALARKQILLVDGLTGLVLAPFVGMSAMRGESRGRQHREAVRLRAADTDSDSDDSDDDLDDRPRGHGPRCGVGRVGPLGASGDVSSSGAGWLPAKGAAEGSPFGWSGSLSGSPYSTTDDGGSSSGASSDGCDLAHLRFRLGRAGAGAVGGH